MKVRRVSGGKTPRIEAEKSSGPSRLKAFAWYFRPRLPVLLFIGAGAYVFAFGWPSLLLNYDYREVAGEHVKTACAYWNPSDGLHRKPPRYGQCPVILGAHNAEQS